MHLEHFALWTRDLERLRAFYGRYFDAQAGPLYRSRRRQGFSSYFLTFPGADPLSKSARLELMTLDSVAASTEPAPHVGYAHLAISLGSRQAVDRLTERLRQDGVEVACDPRVTGDGYYEAVVADPDGNLIELTA